VKALEPPFDLRLRHDRLCYNAANMLLSATGAGASAYSSDAANGVERKHGNTLTGGGRTMAWDSQNRRAGSRGRR
jgi:hypothetical protein